MDDTAKLNAVQRKFDDYFLVSHSLGKVSTDIACLNVASHMDSAEVRTGADGTYEVFEVQFKGRKRGWVIVDASEVDQ